MLDEAKIREAVKGAQAMGWTITAGLGFADDVAKTCCPLAAVVIAGPGDTTEGGWVVTICKLLGVTDKPVWAFTMGFDSNSGNSAAHRLGRKFRRELLPEVDRG